MVHPVAAVFLFAVTLVAREPLTGYSTKTFVMIALLALGPQLVGHSAINWALGFLPVMLVAMSILVEPVGSTALAALILHEHPSPAEMAGGVLVLFGVYLALRPERQQALLAELPAAELAVD